MSELGGRQSADMSDSGIEFEQSSVEFKVMVERDDATIKCASIIR